MRCGARQLLAERREILSSLFGPAAQHANVKPIRRRERRSTPEQDALSTEFSRAGEDRARRLALECRLVDHPLARDDERRPAGLLVEADQVEHQLGACDELAAERRKRGAQATGRARPGKITIWLEHGHPGQPPLEHLDSLWARPF